MKHIKLVALLAALLPCLGQAANVVTTNFGTGVANSGLTNPITMGGALATAGQGIVAVGFFDGTTDAAITAVGDSPAAWAAVAATFQQFGASVTMGTGANNTAGLFSATPAATIGGSTFANKNIYVAIGNAPTLAASTFYAVFKANNTFLPEPNPSVDAFLRDAAAGQGPPGTFLLGTLQAGGSVWYPTGPLAGQTLSGVAMAGVPEPTTALFGLLGLGFGFLRRRR